MGPTRDHENKATTSRNTLDQLQIVLNRDSICCKGHFIKPIQHQDDFPAQLRIGVDTETPENPTIDKYIVDQFFEIMD